MGPSSKNKNFLRKYGLRITTRKSYRIFSIRIDFDQRLCVEDVIDFGMPLYEEDAFEFLMNTTFRIGEPGVAISRLYLPTLELGELFAKKFQANLKGIKFFRDEVDVGLVEGEEGEERWQIVGRRAEEFAREWKQRVVPVFYNKWCGERAVKAADTRKKNRAAKGIVNKADKPKVAQINILKDSVKDANGKVWFNVDSVTAHNFNQLVASGEIHVSNDGKRFSLLSGAENHKKQKKIKNEYYARRTIIENKKYKSNRVRSASLSRLKHDFVKLGVRL